MRMMTVEVVCVIDERAAASMETAVAAVIGTTIAAVEWTVDPFASLQEQHSQQRHPQPKHTTEMRSDQNIRNTTTTIECSTDDHTSLYRRICSGTLSMTTPAMDQSMQNCSTAVQRMVRQRTSSFAVMMAVVVALAGVEAGWRVVVEGVEFRPERKD
jgi:hypothetical protein